MVPLESVKPGDLLEVVPGERIPLDGVVRSGSSEADESLITGEAKPVPKSEGAGVIGGSINLYGAFVLEVTKTGKEGMLSGIIRAVEDARTSRPKIQTTANRVVGYAVPAVLGLSRHQAEYILGLFLQRHLDPPRLFRLSPSPCRRRGHGREFPFCRG